jgi:hypothetical protein
MSDRPINDMCAIKTFNTTSSAHLKYVMEPLQFEASPVCAPNLLQAGNVMSHHINRPMPAANVDLESYLLGYTKRNMGTCDNDMSVPPHSRWGAIKTCGAF